MLFAKTLRPPVDSQGSTTPELKSCSFPGAAVPQTLRSGGRAGTPFRFIVFFDFCDLLDFCSGAYTIRFSCEISHEMHPK